MSSLFLSRLFCSHIHTSRGALPLISGFVPRGGEEVHLGPAKVKPLFLHVLFAPRATASHRHDAQRATGARRNKASSTVVREVRKQKRKGRVSMMKWKATVILTSMLLATGEVRLRGILQGLLPQWEWKRKKHPPKYANVFSWLTAQLTARYAAQRPAPSAFRHPSPLFLSLGLPSQFFFFS